VVTGPPARPPRDLTSRQETILRVLVEEHVSSGHPIARHTASIPACLPEQLL